MGFELWYSESTKYRRNGTSFLELKQIFTDNISTKQIYESLDRVSLTANPHEVKAYLIEKDFDVLGVVDPKGITIGYIHKNNLGDGRIEEYLKKIDQSFLIANNTSFSKLLKVLSLNDFAFVLNNNDIDGIVTKADINKPLFRLYLFGIISLFEMHINFWINKYIKVEIYQILDPGRYESALKIFELRKKKNDQLTILECIQLSDKRDLLLQAPGFLENFGFSKKVFVKFMKTVETVRNETAHSQHSIIDSLDWERFVKVIDDIEIFLDKAEMELIN